MKIRALKDLFKKKTFRYASGKIRIKSEAELSSEQVKKICNIVEEVMEYNFYGCGNQIPKKIVREIGAPIASAEFRYNGRKVFIKIGKKH